VSRRETAGSRTSPNRTWDGGYRRYDILKEATIALGVVATLVLVLTILFSTPDPCAEQVKSWSRSDPVDFVTTAATELDHSSFSGSYGPPYNNGAGAVQHVWFIHLQQWPRDQHPINSAQDFVLAPLRSLTQQPPSSRPSPATRPRPQAHVRLDERVREGAHDAKVTDPEASP